MEGDTKNGKIGWTSLVLYGMSFVRYIMEDFGYFPGEGFILLADTESQARQFQMEFCQKTGIGVKIPKWRVHNPQIENYCCGLMVYQKTMKEQEIELFLAAQGFLPVIICGGVLPDNLRAERYIFRISEEELQAMRDKRFMDFAAGFRSYTIQNVATVCEILKRLEATIPMEEYQGNEEQRKIFSCFIAIGVLIRQYLRRTKTEKQAEDFFEWYLQETVIRIEKFEEFGCGMELPEMVCQVIWDYCRENPELLFSDVAAVNGNICRAIEEQKAILHDLEFYYIPPRLFGKIFQPLLQTVSVPELKSCLSDADILYCNAKDYTVKKQFTTVYGSVERRHFLWVRREFLESPEGLYLEEVFDKNQKR